MVISITHISRSVGSPTDPSEHAVAAVPRRRRWRNMALFSMKQKWTNIRRNHEMILMKFHEIWGIPTILLHFSDKPNRNCPKQVELFK